MEMNMKTQIVLGLSLAVLIGAGGAYAAQRQVKPKLDADGNGVITRAEAQTGAASLFARMDINKDGKLDQADWRLRRETMKTHLFERLDADKDGQLTKTEFLADRGPGMREQGYRNDGDGSAGFGRGHGRHGGTMTGRRGGMMAMAKMADTNGDGAISQAEFTNAALARFDAMDTNKDGQVTQAERQAARDQVKARWQQQRSTTPPQG
jgi:hypothetical protein